MNHKPIRVELTQGSPEWLEYRRGGIGGSDASIIMMGERHPYQSPQELWEVKTGRSAGAEENDAMRRGTELEPLARELYIKSTGIYVEPACFEHPQVRYIRASMDGIDESGRVNVEIKCPSNQAHKQALDGVVPYYYAAQLQHQLMVTGGDECHYWSYSDRKPFGEGECTALVVVRRDEAYINELMKKEIAFWRCVENDTPPTDALLSHDVDPSSGLVGLVMAAGYARSGKDTFVSALNYMMGSKRYAFADSLKEVAIELGLWDGQAETKEEARPKLIALGDEMRKVFPDVWVRGVLSPSTGVYNDMRSFGAAISDCRKVNEMVQGRFAAEAQNVPFRLIWIERPNVEPVHISERDETRLLRNSADRVFINDFDFSGDVYKQKGYQQAVLAAMNPLETRREIYVSDYMKVRKAA